MPEARRARLRTLLSKGRCLKLLEAHSPLSALIVESATHQGSEGEIAQFDGFWSSSLTDSTLLGRPDIEIVDVARRIRAVEDIFDVTEKPLVFDGDTGGHPEHFRLHVRMMEKAGISAVIIEDKTGLKKNSLFGNDVLQHQADIQEFSDKIAAGKAAQDTPDFMIIARIESLILDRGLDDALSRANAYVSAGADGIMIHSRKKDPAEILAFARQFRAQHPAIPLVCVPTSFNETHFSELEAAGFNVVIYANHMLRSAYQAMSKVSTDILRYGRTKEVEDSCLSVNEILNLIPGTR
ncbi:phosphoenolpyruvate mutase [Neorhizobium galegae]|uniref:phosphoenolpyruvate mutase n=2 Tax=Neorhizobium galegae TaxID=399 RepID=A0A6A1TKC7_NEOGA|nr:phosphoenolpyruvate mutase [Neorhizobium galegae]